MTPEPIRQHADNAFAAPVVRVETTTVVSTPGGDQVLDRWIMTAEEIDGVVRNRSKHNWSVREVEEDGSTSLEMAWVRGAAFQYQDSLFSVPDATTHVARRLSSRGDLIQAEFYDSSGAVVSRITVEYDQYGRRTKVVQANDGHVVAEVRSAYDDGMRRIETTLWMRGFRVSSKLCVLNPAGLIEREEETDLGGIVRRVSYSYKLNERGDWIERLAYMDNATEPATRTLRTIVYAVK